MTLFYFDSIVAKHTSCIFRVMKEEIAIRIRMARLTKSLSQENVATELGLTNAAYSNIERGVTDITVSRLFQISIILDKDPIELLGLESLANVGESDLIYKNAMGEQIIVLSQQVAELQARIKQLEEGKEK
jgi:transcriptional regulator with XRE-family HTH domain